MDTAGAIILTIFLLLIAAAIGWVFFTRWRAARLGLPPPPWNPFKSAPTYGAQPAPGGPIAWIQNKIHGFRNRNSRTATGAYEGAGTSLSSQPRRGFGALDPDEAWDTRVGTEADYYGPYDADDHAPQGGLNVPRGGRGGGESYNMNLAATPGQAPAGYGDEERGRTRSRSPGGVGGARGGRNPFDDDAEPSNISLRGVSPRPIDTSVGKGKQTGGEPGSAGSPSERRSVFRENV